MRSYGDRRFAVAGFAWPPCVPEGLASSSLGEAAALFVPSVIERERAGQKRKFSNGPMGHLSLS